MESDTKLLRWKLQRQRQEDDGKSGLEIVIKGID